MTASCMTESESGTPSPSRFTHVSPPTSLLKKLSDSAAEAKNLLRIHTYHTYIHTYVYYIHTYITYINILHTYIYAHTRMHVRAYIHM
jgi:hypothetical protein